MTTSTTVFIQSNQFSTSLKLILPSPDDHLKPTPLPEFANWGFLDSRYSPTKPCFSLDLCTESLGSESGSDTVADSDSIFSDSPPLSPSAAHSVSESVDLEFSTSNYVRNLNSNWSRKGTKEFNFPPPLTTMTGSSSLRVHRHTAEGGRLIIEAVETPFRNSYLHAERSDGRLRMRLVTDAEEASCSGDETKEEDEIGDTEMTTPAVEEEEEISSDFESERDEFISCDQSQNQINREMAGMEKLQRPSRCKDDGRHGRDSSLCCNWKPSLCVIST